MADSRRTRFNTELTNTGQSVLSGTAKSHGQLKDLLRMADATGIKLTLPVAAVRDTWVIAPAAGATNTITIVSLDGKITSVAIADAGGDTLAATFTSGALAIQLANSTDSKNTLTLVKAILDTLNTSTNGNILACFITNTASTQMVHGGTNTLVAAAIGATPGTSLVSTSAGTALTPTPA